MSPGRPCAGGVAAVFLLASASLAAGVPAAQAGDWGEVDLGGYAGSETWVFPQSPVHPGQSAVRLAPAAILEPEFRMTWNGGFSRVVFTPHLRIDGGAYDVHRTVVDIRELAWTHYGRDWWTRLGISRVHWGKLETRRVVDIINQRDLSWRLDPDDKLGQPMINVGIQRDWGSLEGYLLPFFRDGTFPSRSGRLRGPFPVEPDRAVIHSPYGREAVDVAVRYAVTHGAYDFALSGFHGTAREPRVELGYDDGGRPILVPHYDVIDQIGVEGQSTQGALLLKAEGIWRVGSGESFPALSMGGEYTLFSVIGESGDLGLLAEYHYDGRGDKAPPTTIDDELFLGLRWSANDLDDTSLLAGCMFDMATWSQSCMASFEGRLSQNVKLEVDGQIIQNAEPSEQVLYAARRDDYLRVTLSYHF